MEIKWEDNGQSKMMWEDIKITERIKMDGQILLN